MVRYPFNIFISSNNIVIDLSLELKAALQDNLLNT